MPQGGAREGAGRNPLAPELKKKDYKIYLNKNQEKCWNLSKNKTK